MLRAVIHLYAEAFRGLPREVWLLSTGLLVNRAGTMVLPFLSLYLVRELSLPTGAASSVLFAFGLGSVVGSYAGGALAGRAGAVRVQVASLALSGVGFLALGQARGAVALALGAFLVGAINDAYRPACMSAVVEASPPEVRARAMGLMRLAANAGMAIGPAAGGVLASIDYFWIFVAEAATCWLAAVWLFAALRGPETRLDAPVEVGDEREAGAESSLWRDGPFLALLALVFLSAMALFQVFFSLPLYLTADYGMNERQVGLVFAVNAGLIVVFEMVLIKALERRDAARVLGWGFLFMCSGFALLPLGRGLGLAVLTIAVLTVGEMLAFPFSNVLAAKRAGRGQTGQAMGMYAAVFAVALVLAPVVGLWVLDRFGGDVLWTAVGLMGPPLWLAMAALSRRLREPAG